ncbi:MAG TPA: tRNA pseudouridine(38-40) synthase TruA [Myxococcaceae bacterium]|nr:tRNA pseudouridine(38-40) synthase TruA [Myxococcaceae bacterium]
MRSLRAALWLHYRGTEFRGWQRQRIGPTVQATVEEALAAAGLDAGLAAASRTDRGVHARQQIAGLRVPPGTDLESLPSLLRGPGWGCAAAAAAPAGFHAQWSPSVKEYRYRLALGPVPAPWTGGAWEVRAEPRLLGRVPEPAALARALDEATGRRDFAAFHAASSPRRPRTLLTAEVRAAAEGLLDIRVTGDGFGRYQVRALVGGAVLVATGHLTPRTWRSALDEAARFEGLLAPPQGLILWAVDFGALSPFPPGAAERCPREPPFVGPA